MLKFLEDAVELLKETKKPTKDEVINMTIAVLFIVLIAAVFFAFSDYIFIKLYKFFYNLMSGF